MWMRLGRQRADELLRAFQAHCATQYRLLPTEGRIVDQAIVLVQRHFLRAYDAVQLATAITVHESMVFHRLPPIVFLSADDDLIAAARAEGLTTDNPNSYPP
jgi:predicted nucleic acid-binding protein